MRKFKVIKKIFSGEVFFALFLLSGSFKESLNLPVDLAAVFLILTTFSILKRIYKKPEINKINVFPVVLFFVFISLVLVSLFYSPNLDLAQDKTIRLLLLTTPAFVYPFFVLKSKESLTRFLIAIASVAIIMSLLSLPMIFQRGSAIDFVGFNEGNYQGLARVTGVGLVIILFLGVLNSHLKRYRLFFLVSIAVVSITLLASGSRMPIIAVSVALIFIILSTVKIKKWELRYPKYFNKIFIILALLAIPLMWAYNQGYFDAIIYRFEVLVSQGGGAGRTDRFITALEVWKDNFILGSGFGSFSEFYDSNIVGDYPHNLFLEIASELGVVGLTMFTLLLAVAMFRFLKLGKIKKVRNNNLYTTVAIVFLVIFLNAMVSGDINSNRMLLTFIAIMSFLPLVYKKEIKTAHSEHTVQQ